MGLGVFLLIAAVGGLGWFRGLDNRLAAAAFAVRGPIQTKARIVIVPVDRAGASHGEATDAAAFWADLLERLFLGRARVVAVDVADMGGHFGDIVPTSSHFQRLQSLLRSHPVVLPFVIAEGDSRESVVNEVLAPYGCGPGTLPTPPWPRFHAEAPPAQLAVRARGIGALNIYPELDGVVRSVPLLVNYGGTLYPSLGLEVVRLLDGLPAGSARLEGQTIRLGERSYRVLPSGELLVDYAGGYMHYPQVATAEILHEDVAHLRSHLQDAVVLLSPALTQQTATFSTPTAARLPGAEIQANALANLLTGGYLRPAPVTLSALVLLVACVLAGWLIAGRGALGSVLLTLALAAAVWAMHYVLFRNGLWLPVTGPLLGVLLVGAGLVGVDVATADRRKAEAEARLQSRLQAIAGVGRLIDSSLDREGLLNEIMRWVETELNVEACSLLLLDQRRRRLHFEVALGPKGDLAKAFTLEIGEGIAGMVAQTGEPLLVNSAATDPRRHRDIPGAIEYEPEKVACVPMTLHGEVIGVIEAMNKRDGSDFTEYDASLLTVIAQEAALFLENARLYGVLQQRVEYANAELLAAMKQLRSEKARIETLVEEMVDGVLATDEADRIVLVNSRARQMLGLNSRHLDNEPVLAITRDPQLTDLFSRPLSLEGGSVAAEVDLSGDGSQVVRVTLAQIEGPAGEPGGKCAVLTDITQFKLLDQMKTDLISFVSHELKTPLTSLGLYGHLLKERLQRPDPGEALETALAVERQVARMKHMVEDFLNVSRIEAGRPLEMAWAAVTDVRALLDEVINVEGRATRDHHFVVNFPADLPSLWADRAKLEEVFINLVNNAIKYSPDGGQITVLARSEGSLVTFAVRDQGLGIGPEEKNRLFQRYARATGEEGARRISGTGLGLFVCKALVEAHGGAIWVESQLGQGSVFYFTIPIYQGQDSDPSHAFRLPS